MPPGTGTTARWRVAWITGALAVLAFGALSPLGLASGKAVDLAANALGVGRPLTGATPLADLLARPAVLIPLGEIGARPHAIAALAAAVGLALMVARLGLTARPELTMAVPAGAIVVGVSRPFLEITTGRPDAALDFALLAGIALLIELLRLGPARSTVGLGLAFLCGIAAAASWPVRLAAWPVGVALTAWSLRRGERWPLLAPTVFVAGTGIVIGAVVSAAAPPAAVTVTVGGWLRHIMLPSTQGALPPHANLTSLSAHGALASMADDVGVLALLASTIGCVVLLLRAPAETVLWVLLWAGAAVASLAGGDIALARLALVGGLSAPVACAVGTLAGSLGRGRAAAVIVLTVVVAFPAAWQGVGGALAAARRASSGVIARRLDLATPRLARLERVGGAGLDVDAARWSRYIRAIIARRDD